MSIQHISTGDEIKFGVEEIAAFVKEAVWNSTYEYGDCGIHGDMAADAVRVALGHEPRRFDGLSEQLQQDNWRVWVR